MPLRQLPAHRQSNPVRRHCGLNCDRTQPSGDVDTEACPRRHARAAATSSETSAAVPKATTGCAPARNSPASTSSAPCRAADSVALRACWIARCPRNATVPPTMATPPSPPRMKATVTAAAPHPPPTRCLAARHGPVGSDGAPPRGCHDNAAASANNARSRPPPSRQQVVQIVHSRVSAVGVPARDGIHQAVDTPPQDGDLLESASGAIGRRAKRHERLRTTGCALPRDPGRRAQQAPRVNLGGALACSARTTLRAVLNAAAGRRPRPRAPRRPRSGLAASSGPA